MAANETLSASLEDYLEAIFHIIAQKQVARAKDISKRLKVGASSVTGALRSLADRGLINYAPYDVITLTGKGTTAAEDVVRRHEVLRDFFVKVLAIDGDEADEAACRMEHSITKSILERFIEFAEFLEVCPRGGAEWLAGFGYHCDHGRTQENCERCVSRVLEEVREKQARGGRKSMTVVSLGSLKPGQKGIVVKLGVGGEVGRRIVDMGVTRGALIEVERVAPLGDPMEVRVRGYHLSLRQAEAQGIDVELV